MFTILAYILIVIFLFFNPWLLIALIILLGITWENQRFTYINTSKEEEDRKLEKTLNEMEKSILELEKDLGEEVCTKLYNANKEL